MSNSGWSKLTHLPEETKQVAKEWAQTLRSGAVILLEGNLGAGKTTFIKGLAQGLGDIPEALVQSPTFTYLHIYKGGRLPLYHFDLYRLQNAEEFLHQGFDEFLEGNGVACIEWPDRVASLIQPPYWQVTLQHVDENTRKLEITFHA